MKRAFLFVERNRRVFTVLFLISTIYAEDALAYVDPGIGGLIFQIGYIILTGIIVSVTFWLKGLKKLFQKIAKFPKKQK